MSTVFCYCWWQTLQNICRSILASKYNHWGPYHQPYINHELIMTYFILSKHMYSLFLIMVDTTCKVTSPSDPTSCPLRSSPPVTWTFSIFRPPPVPRLWTPLSILPHRHRHSSSSLTTTTLSVPVLSVVGRDRKVGTESQSRTASVHFSVPSTSSTGTVRSLVKVHLFQNPTRVSWSFPRSSFLLDTPPVPFPSPSLLWDHVHFRPKSMSHPQTSKGRRDPPITDSGDSHLSCVGDFRGCVPSHVVRRTKSAYPGDTGSFSFEDPPWPRLWYAL